MRLAIQRTIALVVGLSLSGCSLFGPRMQTIAVSSDPTGAPVFINSERVGNTPLRHQVRRSDDLLVEVRADGYQYGYRTSSRGLSTVGLVDLLGGSVFLIPLIGLISPAAWQHEPSTFVITLEPAAAPTAPDATVSPPVTDDASAGKKSVETTE